MKLDSTDLDTIRDIMDKLDDVALSGFALDVNVIDSTGDTVAVIEVLPYNQAQVTFK